MLEMCLPSHLPLEGCRTNCLRHPLFMKMEMNKRAAAGGNTCIQMRNLISF